jgi:hypothetical protein
VGDRHFLSALIHRCTLQAPVAARSASGEVQVSTYTTVDTAVPCRLVERREHYASPTLGALVKEELFVLFDAGASVQRCYRITDVTLSTDNSVIDAGPFEVKAVYRRFAGTAAHHLSCELERVR